jgi:hypothetical protein
MMFIWLERLPDDVTPEPKHVGDLIFVINGILLFAFVGLKSL